MPESYLNSAEFSQKVRRGSAPDFVYFDGVRASDLQPVRALSEAQREAVRHRLVEARKCPTKEDGAPHAKIAKNLFFCVKPVEKPAIEIDRLPEKPADKTAPVYAVMQFREWSEEYRIRSRVDMARLAPPLPDGKREGWILSSRGARKIAESCEYMAKKHGGYTTFLTLTFNQESRDKIADGTVTVQAEASRFFDALQKKFSREGWAVEQGVEFQGRDGKKKKGLAYCWVVENPANENGEENPHLHILMRWKVPFKEFQAWAADLESIWGHGFAHLEKIEDPEAAGAYMAKAAGYLTKGQYGEKNQGFVRGNRYGISDAARAPSWVTIEEKALDSMGFLISQVSDFITEKHGAKFDERRKLRADREKIKNSKTLSPEQKQKTRAQIAARLAAVRKDIKALPARVSKYQATFRAAEFFNDFIAWAKGEKPAGAVAWLPEKPAQAWKPEQPGGIKKPRSAWYRETMAVFQFYKRLAGAWKIDALADFVSDYIEARENERAEILGAFYGVA